MDDSEKIAHLSAALQAPEGKYTHAQIRDRLDQLTQASTQPASPGGMAPAPPREPSFGDRMSAGAERLGSALAPAARAVGSMANRAINTASFGLADRGEDAIANLGGPRIGDTPEQRDKFQGDHPIAAGTADAVGYMAPGGLPERAAGAVGRGVDALTSALARRTTSSAAGAAARVSARALGGAAKGAITAGTVRGAEGLARGEGPDQAGQEAMDAAESPYSWGAGAAFEAGGGVAGEGARAFRAHSPDIQVLDRAGLEPGPIPGRPVIRKDMPISRQLPGGAEPPPIVPRATPDTRGAVARAAGDTIEGDLNATERANNDRYGALKEEVMSRQGRNPAHLDPAVATIDQHLADLGVHPETKAKLRTLRDMIEVPPGSNKPSGIAVQTKAGRFAPVSGVDGLRRLADQFANQDKLAGAADVPLRQVASQLRDSVETAAPDLAALNKRHSELMYGLDQRRALVGDPEHQGADRNPFAQEREGAARAARVRQAGEETATAGNQTTNSGTRMQRLEALGPPSAHPGAAPVDHPSYSSTLAPPRLQLAQENLQLTPGKLFSGARSGAGVAHRLLHYVPERVGYPLMRRAGEAPLGAKPVAADALIRAIQSRRKQGETTDAN